MPSHEPLTTDQRRVVLTTARDSIAHGLSHGKPLAVSIVDYPEALRAIRASFVTLQIEGRLRGCIGALEASAPLIEDVALHAYGAAFQDPRFPQLGQGELSQLDIHLSILTPNTPIEFNDETDLLGKLRPNEDGLIISQGGRRATFLPSVWESLPDPAQFLAHLKLKAGIRDHVSDGSLKAWRYATESFGEGEKQ